MRTKAYLPVILALVFGSFASCKSDKEKNSEVQNSNKLYTHQFRKKLEAINPGMNDPSAIIQLLEMTGAEFIPGLINDGGMDSIYLKDSVLSAANMGIYTVDLVYLIAYGKDEQVDKQLARARALSENIGAGYLYDYAMYKRYRTTGVHPDTLIRYLSKAAEEMEHDYGEMGLLRLSTLFAVGEFIEKLHLTTQMLIHAD
ncbi:MAG: hypothetical protein KAT15_11710, partial [Bacteroidales bacterium]|nr:hypothetical protein [Bacteroidales bacterium]